MAILKNKKEKAEGVIKEKVGKATGNKKMEIQGKTQGAFADVKSKLNKMRKK